MKKLTLIGITLTLLLGLALWHEQLFVAKAAPMFATITVINNNDSGAGSLRQAIADAASGDTIVFDAAVFFTPQTIMLTSGSLTLTKDVTIQGPGASQLTVSGNNAFRVFVVLAPTVTLDGLTVSGGRSSGDGGGIFNISSTVTITNSAISGNVVTAGGGGGIFNGSGLMAIANSTVNGNSALYGGGILNRSGTLTLTNSTVSGNSAAGNISLGYGGGITNATLSSGGTVTIINSTVSGNSAIGNGGGIYNLSTDTLTIINSTVCGNRADSDGNAAGAGGGIYANGTEMLNNTIVAGNLLGAGMTPDDINGTINMASSNLIGDTATSGGIVDGVNGNKVGFAVGAVLDTTLTNNGGPTLTHALVPGSPALNAGSNALAVDVANQPLTTDQRGTGFPRIIGGTVDIGAFEGVINDPPTITGTTISRQAGSSALSFQIATVNDTESGVGGVSVAVTSANPSNGVTVSNLVNTNGVVTADVAADCTAINSSFTLTVTDGDSATATATLNVTVNANTPPTLGTYSASTVAPGGSTTVTPNAAPSDNGSINSTVSAPGFTGTLSVNAAGVVSIANAGPAGNYVVTVTLTDNCDVPTIRTFNLSVATLFNFVGFFQPVDNLPTVNSATAGSSIPVKFSLTGYQGMAIFAAGFPASQAIACSSGTPDPIEETATAGGSSLSYDATTDRYTYVWKTERAWRGTCRKLVVKFTDGTTREALFQFR